MPGPFDTTTKHLLEAHPDDWLKLLGITGLHAEIVDADLSTLSPEADKVLKIAAAPPWLLHIELQASYDPDLPKRMRFYNELLDYRHDMPVESVVMLLRPQADGSAMAGELSRTGRAGRMSKYFAYEIVRLWEVPAEQILSGGIGVLPLAPLAQFAPGTESAIIHRMQERINVEATPGEAATLWSSTLVLMGLRYNRDTAARLLQGVMAMRESDTYQAILEEGGLNEARKLLVRLGTKRLGPLTPADTHTIASISSPEALEALIERVFAVETWEEVLRSL